MDSEHEDSIFNAQDKTEKMQQGLFDLPERPLNRHEARLSLKKLFKRIDNDLTDEELEEFEGLFAEYGEEWFS